MKSITADNFTFIGYYSALIVGPSGSGKTELAKKILKRYQDKYASDAMKFLLIDPRKKAFPKDDNLINKEYYYKDIISDPETALQTLERLSIMSIQRVFQNSNKPFIIVYIDENDVAAYDQKRFDKAMVTLLKNAHDADMKIIYATSDPNGGVVSKELSHEFDIILYGHLLHQTDMAHLDLPKEHAFDEHSFGLRVQHEHE